MDTNNITLIQEAINEVDRVRYDIINAIDSHEQAVRFAGGDVAASDIINDLEDALDNIDAASVSLRWAESSFRERYL